MRQKYNVVMEAIFAFPNWGAQLNMRELTLPGARSSVCCCPFLLLSGPVRGDVFRPAYLQLKQRDAETFDVTWKVPALDAQTTLKVKPVFPAGTQDVGLRSSIYTMGAAVQRWQVRIPVAGRQACRIYRLALTGLDVLVRVERADGTEQLERVLAVSPRFTLKPSPGALRSSARIPRSESNTY